TTPKRTKPPCRVPKGRQSIARGVRPWYRRPERDEAPEGRQKEFAAGGRLGCAFADPVWLLANLSPILLLDIGVNFDWQCANIESIVAVLPRSGDPVVLSCFDVEVVGFKSLTAQSLKTLAAVIDRHASLRERHATDPRDAVQPGAFEFDVHDAAFHLSALLS